MTCEGMLLVGILNDSLKGGVESNVAENVSVRDCRSGVGGWIPKIWTQKTWY